MSEQVLGKCRYCGSEVMYDNGKVHTKCSVCGETLVIAEFQNEQIKIKRALEEAEQAKKKLEIAEKTIKTEQEKVWKIISDMDGLKGSLKEQEAQLNRILEQSDLDHETQKSMFSLLRVMKSEQQHGQDSILSVLEHIVSEQDTASQKLSALQAISSQLTDQNSDILNSVNQVASWLRSDAEKKDQIVRELFSWLSSRSEQDQEHLKQINAISSSILAKQDVVGEKVDILRKKVEENQAAIESFEGKWNQAELNKLVEQYHQAENLQMNMAFDKAEDEYRKVIIMGGKDPEVYWRVILCHYGVVYQKDNEGNLIPTILRPDLSSQNSIVNDLESSYRSEEDREYYSAKLRQINYLLDKYRHCQMTTQYDVFISVKQKIHHNGKEAFTEDYKIASDLFNHLTETGLRVFNSEQHSCRKPGEEWEPYILSALLSSKIMIVVGTSTEYMESQWVQNEWRRFQWLQREEEKKSGKTDRKLLCFIDNMTGYDLPKDLVPLQAIINKAGAYQELDKAIEGSFPRIKTPTPSPGTENNIEPIRNKMTSWLAFRQFNLVKEEYIKVIREGTYSLDAYIGLCSVCAEHKLTDISMLEAVQFDLSQEKAIRIILKNSKNQNDLNMLRNLLEKNSMNVEQKSKAPGQNLKKKSWGIAYLSALTTLTLTIMAWLTWIGQIRFSYYTDFFDIPKFFITIIHIVLAAIFIVMRKKREPENYYISNSMTHFILLTNIALIAYSLLELAGLLCGLYSIYYSGFRIDILLCILLVFPGITWLVLMFLSERKKQFLSENNNHSGTEHNKKSIWITYLSVLLTIILTVLSWPPDLSPIRFIILLIAVLSVSTAVSFIVILRKRGQEKCHVSDFMTHCILLSNIALIISSLFTIIDFMVKGLYYKLHLEYLYMLTPGIIWVILILLYRRKKYNSSVSKE